MNVKNIIIRRYLYSPLLYLSLRISMCHQIPMCHQNFIHQSKYLTRSKIKEMEHHKLPNISEQLWKEWGDKVKAPSDGNI